MDWLPVEGRIDHYVIELYNESINRVCLVVNMIQNISLFEPLLAIRLSKEFV